MLRAPDLSEDVQAATDYELTPEDKDNPEAALALAMKEETAAQTKFDAAGATEAEKEEATEAKAAATRKVTALTQYINSKQGSVAPENGVGQGGGRRRRRSSKHRKSNKGRKSTKRGKRGTRSKHGKRTKRR